MQIGRKASADHYPYRHSQAAIMLTEGIQWAKARGISLRAIAKALGYKQATALSHMANGRVLVPLKRAADIAQQVGLDPGAFLGAAFEQRDTGAVEIPITFAMTLGNDTFVDDLGEIAGKPLNQLSEEQRAILREVVADPSAGRRWLSLPELPTVSELRRLRPDFSEHGLEEHDRRRIRAALEGRAVKEAVQALDDVRAVGLKPLRDNKS